MTGPPAKAPPACASGVGRESLWLINLFFGIGNSPTGTLAESAAVGLSQHGYEVTAIGGTVGYNSSTKLAAQRFTGRVVGLYAGPADSKGFGGRLVSWLAFYVATGLFLFTRPLPATVVIMTTPPFLHVLFALRNLFAWRKARLVLWNQDTYPEVLASVGMFQTRSLPYRLMAAINRWGSRRMSLGIALDGAMQRIMHEHGVANVVIVPNWEIDATTSDPETAITGPLGTLLDHARSQFRFIVIYTGNYGWGHDLQCVIRYIRDHPFQTDFYFLFVGGGEKWRAIEQLQSETAAPCLGVFPYVSRSQVALLISRADFGLVALESACVGLMSPSKIHGYLTAGVPLIYLGASGSNVAEAIDAYGCGWRIAENDYERFCGVLAAISTTDFNYELMATNAARAARRHTETVVVPELISQIGDSI